MPKITHLKEFEGGLWARLELDNATSEGSVHIFTDKEVKEMRRRERQDCWDEIKRACCEDNPLDYRGDD